jgi:transcription-repair coupling factor (superfamily II helicase)
MALRLRELVPEISFGVAHGQLPTAALEKVMAAFLRHEFDCLVSTNIIESGLDIPNVNTIFIHRPDQFGLADLYQLRGRVGRSKEKAYAYFLLPKNFVLTEEAEKRLEALSRFTDLGAGYRLALEDLEMRGAGNLLGHQQTGFITQVGFDLYCRMLKEAVHRLKSQER